jgi:hypothetical protein
MIQDQIAIQNENDPNIIQYPLLIPICITSIHNQINLDGQKKKRVVIILFKGISKGYSLISEGRGKGYRSLREIFFIPTTKFLNLSLNYFIFQLSIFNNMFILKNISQLFSILTFYFQQYFYFYKSL